MKDFLSNLRLIMREEQAHLNERIEIRAKSSMRTVQGLSLLVFIIFAAYQVVFAFQNGCLDLRLIYLIPLAFVICMGPLAGLLYKKGYTDFLARHALVSMHVLMFLLAFWLDCFTDPSLCVVYTPLFIAVGPVMLLRSMKTELVINTLALLAYCVAALVGITPISADHAVITGIVAYLLSVASLIIISNMRYTIATTTSELESQNARVRVEQEQHHLLQEALNAAQQSNVAKTTFLNSVSHDIRTPMNAIMGFSARAASHIDDPAVVKESLDQINSAGNQLLRYISSILEMTKAKSSRIGFATSKFSLTDLANELSVEVGKASNAKGLFFLADVSGIKDDMVSADRARLRQVLSVALDNAVAYTPEGGHIRFIVTQNQRVSASLIRYTFTVEDDGIGIPEEFLGQIFDPFSRVYDTTHSGVAGAGLGLCLAKSMIESSGGVIHVKSKQGQGTRVEIVLPLGIAVRTSEQQGAPSEEPVAASAKADSQAGCAATAAAEGAGEASAAPTEAAALAGPDADGTASAFGNFGPAACDCATAVPANVAPKESLKGAHVLVVDDNMINREVAGDLLSEKGFAVDTAESGAQALELFEASAPGYYAAVLMDIMMPEMDGMQTTRALRALDRNDAKNVLIVALSANVHSNDSEEAIAAGMNTFLAKPFQVNSFVRILNEML